jgi:hypothetical protein
MMISMLVFGWLASQAGASWARIDRILPFAALAAVEGFVVGYLVHALTPPLRGDLRRKPPVANAAPLPAATTTAVAARPEAATG